MPTPGPQHLTKHSRENGELLHLATVTDRFHELVAAADLPPVRLHDLRHGAALLMIAAGVDLKVVQETLGYSSITLISDTYTSVYPAAAAADAAASLVPRATRPLSRRCHVRVRRLSPRRKTAGQVVRRQGLEPRTR
jgi:integrase